MNDLKHLFLLIVSPGKTWQKMDKVPYATQIFLNQFLYPLINDASLPRALQLAIVEFVKFFAGFYALVYVMKIFSTYMLEVLQPESRIKRFVGYTLALYMLFDISIFVILVFKFFWFLIHFKFFPIFPNCISGASYHSLT